MQLSSLTGKVIIKTMLVILLGISIISIPGLLLVNNISLKTHSAKQDAAITPVMINGEQAQMDNETSPVDAKAVTISPPSEPIRVCNVESILDGPATPPQGAVVVPAGDNAKLIEKWNSNGFSASGKVFWFAPGVHTLGGSEFSQIQPGSSTSFTGAPGAVLDGMNVNMFAFTGHATNVSIQYLTIRNFVAPLDQGVVNHDSASGWTIAHNTITNNGGAGIFLGTDNTASYNCLSDNSQYGFQVYQGDGNANNILLEQNEITGNNTGDWETKRPGCGCTGGGKFWDASSVTIKNNYVHDNKSVGLWADTNNADFVFQGNWIEGNDAAGIFYETSYNAVIRANVLKSNAYKVGKVRIAKQENFPDAAIYISESGGDARVEMSLVGGPTIDIVDNVFTNNYNGVTLWENADRYCGSPANTSSAYCTAVNPDKVTLDTCTQGTIQAEPYYSDCRWKTQNVAVHGNAFSMDIQSLTGCTVEYCGRNSVLSNWGTYPSWSPYVRDTIQKAIVSTQHNTFSDNTYVGDWSFTLGDTGNRVDITRWQVAGFDKSNRQ